VLSSPAVVNGVVYVGSLDGKIYAFGPSPKVAKFPPYLILPLLIILILLATLLGAFVLIILVTESKRKKHTERANEITLTLGPY
jgi:uncharacterized membrane protein